MDFLFLLLIVGGIIWLAAKRKQPPRNPHVMIADDTGPKEEPAPIRPMQHPPAAFDDPDEDDGVDEWDTPSTADYSDPPEAAKPEWDIANPDDQLEAIRAVKLRTRRPINAEAFKAVFSPVERALRDVRPRHRILAEVSMGSFLGTSGWASKDEQDRAFRSFNSKRVDFLVVDTFGAPKVAIEYHGSGHFIGDGVKQRDAVKKAALEQAGVPLIVVEEDTSRAEVIRMVKSSLDGPKTQSKGVANRKAAGHLAS